MDTPSRILARMLRLRRAVLAVYTIVVPIAVVLALRIPNESAIDRLLVPGDPDYATTRAFQVTFPEPQLVLLIFEASDPWAPQALDRIDRATAALRRVRVDSFSVLDVLRRARPGAPPAELRRIATGTTFFRRQALIGPGFLTVIANIDGRGPARDATLAAIDRALSEAGVGPVRRVGEPVVSAWLENESTHATTRSFAIFAVLLVAVTLFLYRSLRALIAVALALGVAVTLAVAAGALFGFAFTIVSAIVPLTVMVTTLATLTYLHSRFVDQPEGVPLEVHHVAALRNKLLPVTASTIAAATGFAALAVSNIRPIREMGLWTSAGLVIAWLVAYTLFPALQAELRTPTRLRVAIRGAYYARLVATLPAFTFRHRWVLVSTACAACVAGAIAVAGMKPDVNALSNIDPHSALYRDLRWFRAHAIDLNVARIWIHLPRPTATDPDVLHALDEVTTAFERIRDVTAVTGPTTPLRMRSYLAGHGEHLPRDPNDFAAAVGDFEQLLLTEPELRAFVDVAGLADVQLVVLFENGDLAGYRALVDRVDHAWHDLRTGALAGAELHVVGEALLQVKIGAGLVPTLVESLLLTVGFILAVFVAIFRSGIERVLALIPSMVALLLALLGLRVLGGSLNVATIIIATTVLGATENDQLHFFHHLHERREPPFEARLYHSLLVSGRAVLFATIINATGFLGLAIASQFPPLRQFGLMTAAAFVLALIADFTALPAALWIVSRERPCGLALDADREAKNDAS